MKDAIDLGMGAPLLPRARTERRLRELVFAATPALFALAAACKASAGRATMRYSA